MATDNDDYKPRNPRIAIVGGGVVGVLLTLGLLRQGISVTVYEQARGFRELGAGMAFTTTARRCMELIDSAIVDAFSRCGSVRVSDKTSDDDYLRWVDGYNLPRANDKTYQRHLADIGGNGFQGCRRDQFLEELSRGIPPGVIEFGKRLETLAKQNEDGLYLLTFSDGSVAEADAVLGCDGLKSRIRQHILGADHPASYPQFTHKVAYRGLVPMTQAIEVLGAWKAHNFHHHVGPGAHITHYPVANHAALNVTVFLSEPRPWPDHSVMVTQGRREEIVAALHGWHPLVLGLVQLLPPELTKWALFDMAEFPAPVYYNGGVCIVGDAAHASSPHHGAGACLGLEDVLCLSRLLGQIHEARQAATAGAKPLPLNHLIEAAFASYDAVRRTRTQWLVNSSRRVCDLYHQYEWADPMRWTKAETCFEELRDRSYKIWHFDVDAMVKQATDEYHHRVKERAACLLGPSGNITVALARGSY